MLPVRKPIHVVIGITVVVLLAVGLIQIHVAINYPPEMHDVIRIRATMATVVVTGLLATLILLQQRRLVLLADELQRLLDRDRLTNVATRDFFFNRMNKRPEAYGVSLMVDIDKFKTINDTYGHLAGDQVIARVANVLCRNVRGDDLVCRFGGEEFIVFLHDQTLETGFAIAERMRRTIETDVVDFNGIAVSATVSIGGSLKDHIMDIELAISEADEALYRAKALGRNRTVFAGAEVGKEGGAAIDPGDAAD
ncbi:GGDEF domain-containing protein [Yoonia sp.]|uniref:GGDEF domain-containing protein n=1 Tax=Yoonia sp. TaxID=2212373 RepID=UPI002FD8A1C3